MEVVRLLFGLDSATTGRLEVDGDKVSRWSPRKAIDSGFAFCPEDRKREGLIGQLTVQENMLLAVQAARSITAPVSRREQLRLSRDYVDRLNIKTPDVQTNVSTLSGGNQQKVLLARWLATKPRLLILDEPTRGIDVGAKAEIEAMIEELSKSGMAVILISSELDDLVRCCDRVVVLRDRRIVGEVTGSEINQQQMMEMIAHHDTA
jgi:simple sugar transport system ATP-binding protein